jgi:hypothetical protein
MYLVQNGYEESRIELTWNLFEVTRDSRGASPAPGDVLEPLAHREASFNGQVGIPRARSQIAEDVRCRDSRCVYRASRVYEA